jgi:glycosyltransferase involved in cell wall biosynthesis
MIKLLQIYNQYRSLFNGEETVVFRTADLIERHGGEARLLMRSSRNMGQSFLSKVQACFSGIYSFSAARDVSRALQEYQPDVVHVHNLYPLFSPSVLVAARRLGFPVVMTLHNQHLTCPRADHLYRGKLCDQCLGGHEYQCALRNCRENILESVAYALRSTVARRFRLYRDNVTVLIALTEFAKQRLVAAGYDGRRIRVLPNMAPQATADGVGSPFNGEYVAFAGRLSPEKGLVTLLAAAKSLPHIPVRIAGGGPLWDYCCQQKTGNVELIGQQSPEAMRDFYRGARLLVLPSVNYEMCPLVIAEAMSHGIPVIASRIGGIPELVDDGRTGLLFEPGNADELAAKIRRLWGDPDLCSQLGRAAWQAALNNYSEEVYFERLMSVYRQAMSAMGRASVDPTYEAPELLETAP